MDDADAPVLAVRDLTRHFDVSPPWLERVLGGGGRRTLRAVDGISFIVRRGTTLALVGESGCGKSTVARCITGLTPPSSGTIEYRFDDTAHASNALPRAMRRRVQMIFQDPYGSLNPRWTVGRIVAEPLKVFGLASRSERGREVACLLESVGLAAGDAEKYPHEFSGGQRQRISIARALAARPDFLVCDEPTSALDVSVQAQVLNILRDMQARLGLTYVFISHDLSTVFQMSDRVGVMYLGRIVELRRTVPLFRRPLHPYTRLLLDAVPLTDVIGQVRAPLSGEVPNPIDPPSGCTFHPRCPIAVERCRREAPMPLDVGDGTVACHAVEEGRSNSLAA